MQTLRSTCVPVIDLKAVFHGDSVMKAPSPDHFLRLLFLVACVPVAGVFTSTPSVRGAMVTQVDNLGFQTQGQNMWGTGESVQLDKTFDTLMSSFNKSGTIDATWLGTGVETDYSVNGKAGLEARLRADSGTVNVNYPLQVSAKLPDQVDPGDTITIDTSSWSHLASKLNTTGPAARFTLDAVFELNASIGPGAITAVGFEIEDFGTAKLSIPKYEKTLIDIGSGASGVEFDTGSWGTVSLNVPEQLNTSTTTLHPPEYQYLESSAIADDKFLNLSVDVDAVAQSLFGFPGDVLEGKYVFVGDDDGDGKADLSLDYTLLNVKADVGLKLAQQFRFTPDDIDVTMTASTGDVKTGKLGDVFSFTAPTDPGEVTIDAAYSLSGDLHNQTGFAANGSLTLEALKVILHNEFFVDFEANLAKDLLALDSDYLLNVELPNGGLQSDPYYIYNKTFDLGGFTPQNAQYSVTVTPESASIVIWMMIGAVGAALAWWQSRRKGAGNNATWNTQPNGNSNTL